MSSRACARQGAEDHFEFADLGWTKGTLADAETFLMECAQHDGIVFSTASDAAEELERNGLWKPKRRNERHAR